MSTPTIDEAINLCKKAKLQVARVIMDEIAKEARRRKLTKIEIWSGGHQCWRGDKHANNDKIYELVSLLRVYSETLTLPNWTAENEWWGSDADNKVIYDPYSFWKP